MTSFPSSLSIRGASEHNLKQIDLDIPLKTLYAITGPSGSGKTSLAVDTIYAESRYRLDAFLALSSVDQSHPHSGPVLHRPAVREIFNLPPVIALEKHGTARAATSIARTLGIDTLLFTLFQEHGVRPCGTCGGIITSHTFSDIREILSKLPELNQTPAPLIAVSALLPQSLDRARIERVIQGGFTRGYRDGVEIALEDLPSETSGSLEIIVDRLRYSSLEEQRLTEALEIAAQLSQDGITVRRIDQSRSSVLGTFSETGICLRCGRAVPAIGRRHFNFSFNFSSQKAAPVPLTIEHLRGAHAAQEDGIETFWDLFLSTSTAEPLTLRTFLLDGLGELRQKLLTVQLRSPILYRLTSIIDTLCALGLSHVNLLRSLRSLSSGELHRVRLTKQLSFSLSGLAYVIDEPSTGLHASDQTKLADFLLELRDRNNTIIIVDHERALLERSDYMLQLGPSAGRQGGSIMAAGKTADIFTAAPLTLPAPSLTVDNSPQLRLTGARLHNLKNLTVEFPLTQLCGVSGVSGSGKSTLLFDELLPRLSAAIAQTTTDEVSTQLMLPKNFRLKQVVSYRSSGTDQNFAAQSTVATVSGLMEPLTTLFARMPLAKMRGLSARHFTKPSPDLSAVRFKGFSISEILERTVEEALSILGAIRPVAAVLRLIDEFGLSHLTLAQPVRAVSAGERQRLLLVRTLARRRAGGIIYLFDEPTAGLSDEEVKHVTQIFKRVIDRGNAIIAIEHNLTFLSQVEYLVDLGPGAGPQGGSLVYSGPTAGVITATHSLTGAALAHAVARGQ